MGSIEADQMLLSLLSELGLPELGLPACLCPHEKMFHEGLKKLIMTDLILYLIKLMWHSGSCIIVMTAY